MRTSRLRPWLQPAALLGSSALLLGGCGGTKTNTHDVTPPAVKITTDDIHVNAAGQSTPGPSDVSRLFIEAHYQDSSGHWRVMPAELLSNGSFNIPDVPANQPVWLRVFNGHESIDRFIWTDSREINLNHSVLGRADVQPATNVETKLVANASGLRTWENFDQLEVLDVNQGFARQATDSYRSENGPSPGDSSVHDFTWHWMGFPLSDAAKGDRMQMTQVHMFTDDASGFAYSTPVRTMQFDPFTQQNGGTTTIQGALQDTPPFEYQLNFARSAFNSLKTSVHPTWTQDSYFQRVSVTVQPFAGTYGPMLPFSPTVIGNVRLPQGVEDFSITIHGGNPYPAEWLVNTYEMDFPVTLPAPDEDNVSTQLDSYIGFTSTTLTTATSPAVPLLSPARQAKVGGQELTSLRKDVGLSPTISWSAPTTGTATSYELNVQSTHVDRDYGPHPGAHMIVDDVAQFIVPGDVTQVTLPAEVLAKDSYYFIRIRAISEPGQDIRKAPFHHALPSAWADLFTDYFQP